MEKYAASLKLTYKQVRGWFIERRRKEKREKEVLCARNTSSIYEGLPPACISSRASERKMPERCNLGQGKEKNLRYSMYNETQYLESNLSKKNLYAQLVEHGDEQRVSGQPINSSMAGIKNIKRNRRQLLLQDLLSSDYILEKIFRKDGPPLGVEFDSLPAAAFGNNSGANPSSLDCPKGLKRRKVLNPLTLDCHLKIPRVLEYQPRNSGILETLGREPKSAPVKKYGIGKGLMTVWRATNPDGESFRSVNFLNREVAKACLKSTLSIPRKLLRRETKNSEYRRIAAKQRTLGKKLTEKKNPSMKKPKATCKNNENRKVLHKAECILALDGLGAEAQSDVSTELMDDEELELRELQAGPNPLTCSAHITTKGQHDLLARFPPQSVKMKQPLLARPWNSSPEVVKKLFKVFRFLYTHSVVINLCPFTFDEFAQAFHDKDSLLLGKIHVALLKLILLDVDQELHGDFLSWPAKDRRFLGFLHFVEEGVRKRGLFKSNSVRQQEFDMKFWSRALNPLTWAEILRLVLIAAGFGSNQNAMRREILGKEGSHMAKYGLRPGTLKGELFSILYGQGSNGLKVSELAKSFKLWLSSNTIFYVLNWKIVELNLPNTEYELENMICSTLASDITLFEKISPSTYRLRVNPQILREKRNASSDTEDSGSVDDDSSDSSSDGSGSDSDDSSGLEPAPFEQRLVRYKGHRKQKNNKLTVYTEIDESSSGEAWVLGLMEGEYSDLSIEEKLNALVAVVDLAAAGYSIRTENPVHTISEVTSNIGHHGSGAKLKRSSVNQHMGKSFQGHVGIHPKKQAHTSEELLLVGTSKTNDAESREKSGSTLHPMKSIYLGSDRRYNSYWLFLGPCDEKDPGHRMVYFESSEDGHWEVIDTEEVFCSLLSVLDDRGVREAHLLSSLERHEAVLCKAMAKNMAVVNEMRQPARSDQSDVDTNSGDGSSPISDVDNNLTSNEILNDCMASSGAIVLENGKNGEVKRQRWDRLQALDAWIWNCFYSSLNAVKYSKRSYMETLARCESCHDLYWRDEKHCKKCHITFELHFDMEERYAIHTATCREKEDGDLFPSHKVLPSQLQCLKAAVHAIEAAMPEDALLGAWRKSAHKLWVKRLRRTSSLSELLQVLNDFVGAINEGWLCNCNVSLGPNSALEEILIFFPTLPQTTCAVGLWLVKLDAVIAPHLENIQSEQAPAYKIPRLRGGHNTAKGREESIRMNPINPVTILQMLPERKCFCKCGFVVSVGLLLECGTSMFTLDSFSALDDGQEFSFPGTSHFKVSFYHGWSI
ncbi:hypothetical protein ACLOJK_021514 [Asimina triloba]